MNNTKKNHYKNYYLKNKEKKRQYYLLNKEKILEKKKLYRIKNSELLKQKKLKYNLENKEKRKEYYLNNKDRIKKYRLNNKQKFNQYNSIYRMKKRKKDPCYKILNILRSRLYSAIKNNKKFNSSLELLGCSPKELKVYLESKFKTGMSWDNHGKYGWHIDHIKPCVSFDLTDIEQQKQCFHYSNLQPLWWWENLSKGNKKPP